MTNAVFQLFRLGCLSADTHRPCQWRAATSDIKRVGSQPSPMAVIGFYRLVNNVHSDVVTIIEEVLDFHCILQDCSVGVGETIALSCDVIRPGDSALHRDITAVDSEVSRIDHHGVVAIVCIAGSQHIVVCSNSLICIGTDVGDSTQIGSVDQSIDRAGE